EAHEEVGELGSLAGEVAIVAPDGARRPASAGAIPAEGKIVTGANGRAVLLFRDGTRLELGENGDLAWAASGDQLVLTPGRATLLAHVPPPKKGARAFSLTIKTPYGTAALEPDSEASIVAGRDRTTFDVRLGRIGVQDRKGKRIELRVGDRIEL